MSRPRPNRRDCIQKAVRKCAGLGWLLIVHPSLDDIERFLKTAPGSLVAPTVIRLMHPATGGEQCLVSLQVLWPEPITPVPGLDLFDEFDVWRAAVFDAVIGNTDRSQNNWLGIGPDMTGQLHLKLYDHGHAFTDAAPSSTFVSWADDRSAPATVRDEITIGLNTWPADPLLSLLGNTAVDVQRRLASIAGGAIVREVQ